MKKIRLHKPMLPSKINIDDIIKTGMVTNYKYVRKLEKKLKNIHNVKYVICFSNCTTAINMLLYIINPKTIALPSFTWTSPKYLIQINKIVSHYMNIDKEFWVVSEEEQIKYNNKTDLFLLGSTFGNKPFIVYPKKTIIDSAHCAGHSGFGNLALAEVISFSPMKTFTGIEGGAVLTNDKKLAIQLLELQPIMGRMGEINAKIALYNLNRKKQIFSWKEKIFKEYKQKLGAWRFQKINKYSSLNEILMSINDFTKKQKEKLNNVLEIRKRYNPNFLKHKETNTVALNIFNNTIVLPSYLNCDYKKIIKIINEIKNE